MPTWQKGRRVTALFERSGRPAVAPHSPLTFFRIPPFPGAQVTAFTPEADSDRVAPPFADGLALLREMRVGGTFWGHQPQLPDRCLIVRSLDLAIKAPSEAAGAPLIRWTFDGQPSGDAIVGDCDPWHMLRDAVGLVCHAEDEVRLVAALLGVATYIVEPDGELRHGDEAERAALLSDALPLAARFANPFGGDPLSLFELIELCGFWRGLIDGNRDIVGAQGFAFWKRKTVLPLLWDGGGSNLFSDGGDRSGDQGAIAVWRSKVPSEAMAELERRGVPLVEVEDGFLRSTGLGADCVPPLSITVDRLGAYFDPGRMSELEELLEYDEIAPALVARAEAIRRVIVAAGLGKYGSSKEKIARFDTEKRHILVPGQVEDDRSVMTGGGGLTTNRELLERVRKREPEAFIIYKPHPDVVAGHRIGLIPDQICRLLADIVVTDRPISALIDMVDDVHVNTSLAGFEALMRHKNVTTHGVPFYAGWGLTRDLGPVPARRTRRRSLDELVAATLLLYPRYLDPLSGLPCPAEVVVDRLTRPGTSRVGALVRLRRAEGRMRAMLSGWRAKARR